MACYPYWDKTIFLADFETDFSDAKGATPTAYGNADVTTSSPKIGTRCATFDGTGDYVTYPMPRAMETGTGDITIHFWFKSTQTLAYATMLNSKWGEGGNGNICMLRNSTSGPISYWEESYSTGSPLLYGTTTSHGDGNWHHYAYCRKGGWNGLALDGTFEAVALSGHSRGIGSTLLTLGKDIVYGRDFNGQLDYVHIVNECLWTENFTPPTTAITQTQCAVSGKTNTDGSTSYLVRAYDEQSGEFIGETLSDDATGAYSIPISSTNEVNVVRVEGTPYIPSEDRRALTFLLPFNATVTEESTGEAVVTNSGVTANSTYSVFGGYSGEFGGSNYLSLNTKRAIGFGDFTFSLRVRVPSFANYRTLLDTRINSGDTDSFAFGINSSGGLYLYSNGFIFTPATAHLTVDTFAEVTLCRRKGLVRAFVNGTFASGTAKSFRNYLSLHRILIGRSSASVDGLIGYVDNCALFVGKALYWDDYTTPGSAFSAAGGAETSVGTPAEQGQIFDHVTPA